MDYINTSEAAEKWGVGLRRAQYYCSHNMVPGARHVGKQWLIPADAERPADRRTQYGKAQKADSHHFPVFIYSPCYADPSDLNENEQRLLQAQILRMEGEFVECIKICQEILSGYVSPYLAAGVYLTIGYVSFLVGIASGYQNALSKLDAIIDAGTHHVEDVKLMRASLYSHASADCSQLYAINSEELSIEAVLYHKYCLLSAIILSGRPDKMAAICYIKSDLPQIKRSGITPAVFSFHCLLGSVKSTDFSMQERESHMHAAVKLAVENNWFANLCKYSIVSPDLIEKCVASHGAKYSARLKKLSHDTIKGWHAIHATEVGSDELRRYSNEQIELLLLVSYRYPNKTIAAVKFMEKAEVDHAVTELCAKAGVSTKAELMEYANKIIFPSN